ncbi:MAG TPA: monomeric [FeFe] hydrogenase [Dissulfurispiraceae bacterium]|nr:monomeric [FeFe] hydrogenase [Dissulfurispiraceae bacterium]
MWLISNITKIRRECYAEVARLIFNDRLIEEIDDLPKKLFPEHLAPQRCCLFSDRAIVSLQIRIVLGLNLDEAKNLTLEDCAKKAIFLDSTDVFKENLLQVIDAACQSCPRERYYVSDVCRNCTGHFCISSCPKEAIVIINNRATIDTAKCVECGLCQKGCPYKAIIETRRPCEIACVIKAIVPGEDKKAVINKEDCVYCGSCSRSCPFGAISEKTHLVQLIRDIKKGERIAAVVAPSIRGQFGPKVNFEQLSTALLKTGFCRVEEVARGADMVAENEAGEFIKMIESGDKFAITSCCPAFSGLIHKKYPEQKRTICYSPSPMIKIGSVVKERYPEEKVCFIGPCVSKKWESVNTKAIDYCLTFEELAALFVALNIDVSKMSETMLGEKPTRYGIGFPVSGGISKAIAAKVKEKSQLEVHPYIINGIEDETFKELAQIFQGANSYNLIEGIFCNESCCGGPGVLVPPRNSRREVEKAVRDLKEK